jgi:hypothetical protein
VGLLPLALVAACAAAADRMPRAASAGDARALVGHGEGATPTEAHAAALADLAAQVRARVWARTRRLAQAGVEADRVWGSVRASQEIEVETRLVYAELARRQRVHLDEAGRASVILVLGRAEWAARRRAEVAEEARLVLGEIGRRSTAPSVVRWHALGRAVAAARVWRAAEEEASTIDPSSGDATPTIDQALAALLTARDAQARGLECVVRIEGDAALQAVAAAACGASPTPSLLGAPASDAHRLLVRGRVVRTLVGDAGLVFAESRAVLVLEGDGRTLETLVVGGPAVRRGHLDAARARAAADSALLALTQAELEARFR